MSGAPRSDRHPVKRELAALLLAAATGIALLALLYTAQIYYATKRQHAIRGFHDEAIVLARELEDAYFSARLPRGIDPSARPQLSDPVAFTSQAELAYNAVAGYSVALLDRYARHPGPPFDSMRSRLERAAGEMHALHAQHDGDPEGFARAFSTAPLYVEIVSEQIVRLHDAQGRALKAAQARAALVSWIAFLAAGAVLGALVFWRARRNLRAIDAILADEQAGVVALRKSEGEKEVLLREVYHRVKNNMQVVASLLAIQGRAAGPGQAQELLKESAERVGSMALVHEQLYGSQDLARIPVAEYIGMLLNRLGHIYSAASRGISMSADIAALEIGVDDAVPLGLIVCELVSNACKHAFPDGRGGSIRVALQALESGELELTVRDDGRGTPGDWKPGDAATLGSQLVAALSAQLGGAFRPVTDDAGACFKVRFPRPGRAQPRRPNGR